MQKKSISLVLVLVFTLTLTIPACATNYAPEDGYNENTTYGQLEVIVRDTVEQQLGENSFFDQVQAYVKGVVTKSVMDLFGNSGAILGFVSPILSGILNKMINSSLAETGNILDPIDVSGVLENVLHNEIIDRILSVKIINVIRERTIVYTVDAIMAQALPSLNQAQANKEALIKKYSDYFFEMQASSVSFLGVKVQSSWIGMSYLNPFWSFSLKNTTVFGNQIPTGAEVTGWNSALVNAGIISGQAFGNVSDIASFNMNDFLGDLPNVIRKSAQKAAVDVVTERIEVAKVHIRAVVQAETQKAKDRIEAEMKAEIEKVK